MSENPTPELQMMIGSGGKMDYLVVGKKQGYLLGLKLAGVGPTPGGQATALALRIRSAKDPYHVPEDTEIISFEDKKLTPATAWEGIKWENLNNTRASVVMATIINGTPHRNAEILLQGLKEAPEKIANLMTQLCPEEYRVVSSETLQTWIDEKLEDFRIGVEKTIQSTSKAAEIAESQAGVFQTQGDLMKKMYGETTAAEEPVPDEEPEEDEDPDDDYDPIDDEEDHDDKPPKE